MEILLLFYFEVATSRRLNTITSIAIRMAEYPSKTTIDLIKSPRTETINPGWQYVNGKYFKNLNPLRSSDSDNKIAPPFIDAMYTIIAISIVLRPPLNNSASNDIKAIKKIIIAIYPILYFTQSLNAESLVAPENVIFSIFSFPLKPYLINPYINETTFVIKR